MSDFKFETTSDEAAEALKSQIQGKTGWNKLLLLRSVAEADEIQSSSLGRAQNLLELMQPEGGTML